MNFLDLQYYVLQCAGIFSFKTLFKWKLLIFNVYRAIIFFVLSVFTVLMTIQIFLSPDISILARTIDMWTMFLSGLYKWLMMLRFKDDFAKLRTNLIKIQIQGSVANGDSTNDIMENNLKQTKKMTLWYLLSGVFAIILVDGSPFIAYPKRDRSDHDYFNDPKTYPYLLWIPFEIKHYWVFIVMFTLHIFSSILIVLIYLGIDSFLFSAIYNVGGEIDLLNTSLNNVKNAMSTGNNALESNQLTQCTVKQNDKCYIMLKECTKHHILIMEYIKKISTVFSSLIFVDYIHGSISLTFALFQLTVSNGIGEIINAMYFFGLSISHQYLNNYFGELIIQKQLSVLMPLCDVPWWRADKKIRVMLSLMILRSMKPTLITGCCVYKLCHETFLKFSKGLYSYYMLLRRINMETNDQYI